MEKIPFDENNCSYLEYLNCHTGSNSFEMKSTTSSIVCSLLDKLCKSKATGLEKISARLLRCCSDLLSESLTVIFNCSINTGIFPDEWKCSKVIPLFKHGERGDLNNYRPILIIPVVAKVFERIIFDQTMPFLLTATHYVIASQDFDVYIQLSLRFLSTPIAGHTILTKVELML